MVDSPYEEVACGFYGSNEYQTVIVERHKATKTDISVCLLVTEFVVSLE